MAGVQKDSRKRKIGRKKKGGTEYTRREVVRKAGMIVTAAALANAGVLSPGALAQRQEPRDQPERQPERPPDQDLARLARLFFEEVWTKGNFRLVDELFARDFVFHPPVSQEGVSIRGADGVRRLLEVSRGGFPDLTVKVDFQTVERNTVVTLWTQTGTHSGGPNPTRKRVTVRGTTTFRFENRRIVEARVDWDAWGLQRQLGLPLVIEVLAAFPAQMLQET